MKRSVKKLKAKSNFVCIICGFIDRIFGNIYINENGEAISGFIAGRKEVYLKNVSIEINNTQKEVNEYRTFADEQISQFSQDDVRLLYHCHETAGERRRGIKVAKNIDSLFNVNNSVKATNVKLHGELNSLNAELKRQLTAYLLAGFGKKKRSSINVEASITASVETLLAYQKYVESYQYVDRFIKEFVDKVVNYGDKISKVKVEEDQNENS